MTRQKTDEEKAFNKEAKKYGLKSFTAKEFDDNPVLRSAFHAYVISSEEKSKGKKFNLDKYCVIYASFFGEKSEELHGMTSSKREDMQIAKETQELFQLLIPIPEISRRLYSEINVAGFASISIGDNEFKKDDTVMKIIEKWHDIRRKIDKFVPYIEKRYPRWSNATKVEKQDFKKDIKKNLEELKILGIESEELDLLLSFVNNYGLNQIKSFKADYLLYLELPYIKSKAIATKIIENSKV